MKKSGRRNGLTSHRPIRSALVLCSLVWFGAVAADAKQLVPSTYGDAMRWYVRAAEEGRARAQFLLALKYQEGVGVERDLTSARAWFARAAVQRHPQAQFKLGVMLELGEGGAADPETAAVWYTAAARNGFAPAQYNIGVAYLNASGVDHDPVSALAWLSIAWRAGMADSAKLIERLRDELPQVDILEATLLADSLASGIHPTER